MDDGAEEGVESLSPGGADTAVAIDDGMAAASGTIGGGGGGGVKKVKIAGLYKPPTHEELQSLKETQNLFKSNLMRLQVRTLHSVAVM